MTADKCYVCKGKGTIPAPFYTEMDCPECTVYTRAEPASDTPGGEVRRALNYAIHARELLNDGEIENADGLLGNCIAALTPQPSQNAGDVEKDGWDRAAKLRADIFYFREAYKNEWEDFDLQRFDRMEKCVDYLTKGKTND